MAKYRKLGRTSSQRKAMIRSQVTALLQHGKIVTTEARAKEIRKVAEGLIAKAVKEKDNFETVKVRRQMMKVLYEVTEVPTAAAGRKKNTKSVDLTAKLFDEIAPKYVNRNGGYTRLVKIGMRKGDGAMEVLLELV